jgi:beta-barrel assembly-enhancing protease
MVRMTRCAVLLASVMCAVVWVSAQTPITPPNNKFSLDDDVREGRAAAAEVEKQMPILADDGVTSYVQEVGARLAGSIPPELQHPEFHYTFKVVNVKDINAFALPGGPMYVHRGIIEAAQTEGELAGVMAHEMSHVALRHGTAQATKASKFGFGALAGAIVGAVVGGNLGVAISEGTQFGLSTTFLRFSRDYEKQADLLGVQMMGPAGYDPRDLAHMFQTIEKEGGDRPPQWMSDHPNPGNRVQYINEEASHVPVTNPVGESRAFSEIQAHLKTLEPAPTMAELAKRNKPRGPQKP